MALTLPYPTFTAGTVIDPAAVNANNTAIVVKFSAGIVNGDISGSAGIGHTKLDAYYEHMDVNMLVRTGDLAAGWAGGNIIVAGVPVPGVNGDTPWTVTAATWCCTDTGGGVGTLDLFWGYFSGNPGAFTGATILSAPTTIANSGAAGDSNDGTCSLSAATVDLSFTANSPHHLILKSVGADAACLAGGAIYDFLSVTVRLRRAISAS